MIIIFFDLGVVSVAFLILMLAGMGVVTEIGIWFHEHFLLVAVILIIVAIVKTVFLVSNMNKKLYEGILCSIADAFRMIPAWIFLRALFASFASLRGEGAFGFVLGFLATIVGICAAAVPTLFLALGTEEICAHLMEDEENGWVLFYLIVALIGTGLQLLFFKWIGIL